MTQNVRDDIQRAVLNFRARSGTTQYSSGHALQPSDAVRLVDDIMAALAFPIDGDWTIIREIRGAPPPDPNAVVSVIVETTPGREVVPGHRDP